MRLTKQEFIDRFSPDEVENLMAAEFLSPAIKGWLFRFNNLTPDPDGTSIDTLDPRTVAGLHSLEESGLLLTGRASKILGNVVSLGEFAIGQLVKIKAPFNVAFPDVYPITGVGTGSIQIGDSAEFAFMYVEKL